MSRVENSPLFFGLIVSFHIFAPSASCIDNLIFLALFNVSPDIEIISAFLPKQLSEEETKKICNEVIKKLNASSIKDMGKVMGTLKKNHADTLDFSKAGSYLKEALNKK